MEFTVIDKTRRAISLNPKRYFHIVNNHPEVLNCFEEIKRILRYPDTLLLPEFDNSIGYYYGHVKKRRKWGKYLKVVVKYLNGNGYIITIHFTNKLT